MMAEIDESGGLDYHFVEEPPDTLVCPVCLLPCREPHLISCCGKKVCYSCISRVQLAGQPCPLCRTPEFATMIDREVERQVLSLKVYCNNKQHGCTWIGELRQLERHSNFCFHVYLSCKYKCGLSCFRQQMLIHERDECELRPEIVLTKTIDELTKKIVEYEDNLLLLRTRHETEVTELQKKGRLMRCLEEYEQVATENVELKKGQKRQVTPTQSGGVNVDVMMAELTDHREKMGELELELEQFQMKHDERIAEKNLAIEHLQESLETKETELNGLKNQETAMKRSIEALNVENGQLKRQIHDLQKKGQKRQVTPTQSGGVNVDVMMAELTDHREKMGELELELEQFQMKHDERIAEKNLAIEQLQESLETKETELNGLKHQETAMKSSIEALNVENGQLKRQIHDLQKKGQKRQVTPTQSGGVNVDAMMAELTDHREKMETKETAMKRSIEALNVENGQLKRQIHDLQKKGQKRQVTPTQSGGVNVDAMMAELTDHREKMGELELELEQFQMKHDERIAEKNLAIEQLQESLETKETELNGLKNQETAMKRSIEALNVENGQLKRQIYDLQKRLGNYAPPQQGHPPPYIPVYPPPPQRPQPPPHRSEATSRVCPICNLVYPTRMSQQEFECHVNTHFQ